jgi:hypothetical protein
MAKEKEVCEYCDKPTRKRYICLDAHNADGSCKMVCLTCLRRVRRGVQKLGRQIAAFFNA